MQPLKKLFGGKEHHYDVGETKGLELILLEIRASKR